MRLVIALPRLQLPDAVGHDVLEQLKCFRAAGHDVRICAESSAPGVAPDETILAPEQLANILKNPDDVLIYHYAVHSARMLAAWQQTTARRILRYHNVTPAHFVEPYDRGYAEILRAGRALLREYIAAGYDLALGDSRENVRDLLTAGALPDRCQTIPPFHSIPELLDGEPDADWLAALGQGPVQNLLMVGRLAPNKGYEHLLRAFALVHRERPGRVRLILAGAQDRRFRRYYQQLQSIIEETGIAGAVWIPGGVSLAALRAMYRTADLLVVASEHEGFCVPLVEAMAHGLPIVACNSTAVPETMAEAGLLVSASDVTEMAAAIGNLLGAPELREKLGAIGLARYRQQFTNETIARRLLKVLQDLTTYAPHRPSDSAPAA